VQLQPLSITLTGSHSDCRKIRDPISNCVVAALYSFLVGRDGVDMLSGRSVSGDAASASD